MYQIDSLTMYALKQAEAVISQSYTIFDQMIDDSLAFNQAMMNFDFVEMTSAEVIEFMFPSVPAGSSKKNQLSRSVLRRPRRLRRRRHHMTT